jgi:2,3-bisphosphoglycerate-independent phosphoglycerate mutase
MPHSSLPSRPLVALVILDGFGLAPDGPGNAVARAHTPHFDRLWAEWPHTELAASGRAVGLPEGQIGNSEVGHMNLGAGRVVMQSLTFIESLIESGEFFENRVLNDAYAAASGGALHLMGLVSRGGVHSDLTHLFGLLELAKRRDVRPVYVHVFTDGRDVPPTSGLGFVAELEEEIRRLGHDIRIASVGGRYYAMDRDNRWERVQRAYDAVVCGTSDVIATDALGAIRRAYERGETDEFIAPTVIVGPDGRAVGPVRDGDSVVFFNFRADRARQFTYALMGSPDWDRFERCRRVDVSYASLMQYDRELGLPYAFELPELRRGLSEVVSEAGLKQFHAAETEKYPHVTYFFNTALEVQFAGEDRHMVPSPKVATYDLQPEMSAPELTEATARRIATADDAFVLVNFANPDMVGHTGVFEAAVRACEAADAGLGRIRDAVESRGGVLVVIADHGNAEVMIDTDGGPHTAHTTNPVPCIVAGAADGLNLRSGGALGDVAPTVLELLGLEQPPEMTGRSLLVRPGGA